MIPIATRTTDPHYSASWRRLFRLRRNTYALSFWFLSLALFWQPLRSLAILSFHEELASHVLVIPLISGFLIYLERNRIFSAPRYCPALGLPVLLTAVALWTLLPHELSSLGTSDRLSVLAALIVLTWIAGFLFFYGTSPFQAALFPLLFLFLMSPLPMVLSNRLTSLLQSGSAAASYTLFRLIGVPVIRHGFLFSLPGCEIEVAEQCSGIHSGLSLFFAGMLAEYVLLPGTWRKACFTLCIFPIAVFKNAVRIVTIAWLGIYVNPAFFQGQLHRQGGLPFSLLALALMGVVLWLLRHPTKSFRSRQT
jgi:exosortase